ncbi:MAG TPA: hypothetical protein VFD37_05510, partial [Solirubrobacterales bacterium]|nr:hypothetical protein [Solirubrobacterales bacterium]
TLLESLDDTNDSATDFIERDPEPRSNSSTITETECNAPQTFIDSAPASPTMSTEASFTYSSDPAGSSFRCRRYLSSSTTPPSFGACDPGGIDYPGPLLDGEHTFEVRATDEDGTDPTPASYTWTVDTIAPTVTIASAPDDPSHGASASFSFHADENGVSFECSRAATGEEDDFSPCTSTKTYNDLPDSEHTFKVRGADPAGNRGDPATYTWQVDNSLADTTPPQTSVDSRPPNPTSSPDVSFTYSSSEPGSTFECKLDAGAFSSCSATGITYAGLANGTHTFQVRAIDPSGNTDLSPAGFTFDVAVTGSEPEEEKKGSAGPEDQDPPPPSERRSDHPPGTALAAGLVPARAGRAIVRMRCFGRRGARCAGALRLIARVVTRRGGRRVARRLAVGGARFDYPAGPAVYATSVRLTRPGRLLLRRAGRRGLRADLAGRGLRNRLVVLRPVARRPSARRMLNGDTGANR